ncbi:MAG: hypothetical protein CVU38_16490 [Chloroflexi bacterium HGW-Chloroflexi-1]|nr:MAG: hypothetical protein CVU38_16490 [Chloroflexi bacterium HGW-Chloroflexi-1]
MHNEIEILMSMVFDGEATPAEAAQVRAHLTTCAACSESWQRWQVLDTCLASAPPLIPPPDFVASVMARLGERRRRRSRSRWFGSGMVLASALVLVGFWLIVAALLWWGHQHPLEVGIALSSGAQFLSSLTWILRGLGTLFGSVDGVVLKLGAGFGLSLTFALVLLWFWVMSRSPGWVRMPAPMH